MKSRCLSRLVSSWILSLCAGILLPLALPTPALAQNENDRRRVRVKDVPIP
jgi:hypothetical protein